MLHFFVNLNTADLMWLIEDCDERRLLRVDDGDATMLLSFVLDLGVLEVYVQDCFNSECVWCDASGIYDVIADVDCEGTSFTEWSNTFELDDSNTLCLEISRGNDTLPSSCESGDACLIFTA